MRHSAAVGQKTVITMPLGDGIWDENMPMSRMSSRLLR